MHVLMCTYTIEVIVGGLRIAESNTLQSEVPCVAQGQRNRNKFTVFAKSNIPQMCNHTFTVKRQFCHQLKKKSHTNQTDSNPVIKMAQVPQISRNPVEVLTNKSLIEEPFLFRYWTTGLLGSMTFLGVCVANWYIKRPMFSGIQQHILLTSGATIFGYYYQKHRDEYLAERDAILRHYISLHREDFPDFESTKIGMIFEPWIPVR
ncbi:hypothetical protein RN001_003798 [Aquatica leii]|uniref:NADH dehydrogenase [ubiquinone] 1 subunit C2 n=1 Tax=Aquatica leii TaxID=1421715 RepID=A0AAN7Q9W1_9COLE|nr:hypothetical protein RN001_003798 [Aquatica leii]